MLVIAYSQYNVALFVLYQVFQEGSSSLNFGFSEQGNEIWGASIISYLLTHEATFIYFRKVSALYIFKLK